MKRIIIPLLAFFASTGLGAQSVALYQGEKPIAVHSSAELDSIVFLADNQQITPPHHHIYLTILK